MSMLDRKQGKPIFRQIAETLQQDIQQHYQAGDCLPSEQELADRFSVNRHTLRRGIDELVSLGLVERVHGKGVFVLDAPVDYAIGKHSRFTENLEALGKTSDSRLLRKLEIKAKGNVAKMLQIAEGDAVLWLETLRKVDDKPFCVISHYLPIARLGEGIRDYETGSLHAFFKNMGLKPVRLGSTVSATLPLDEDGLLLAMPRHLPVLRVKTVNVDVKTQKPIEYSLARFRADRAQISINIE
ncbi:MAG: phosphonate metabolism transcriptional regulator PhnF [Methylococcaceae bacterium]|nr:phosphonate metabolism transcriptional regulator PhnF [Methylococcaceae bacterium]MDZ4155704.1 phosphonate metabolism transcriptional regulator PhnF [Methylococcales bacterium]MDP2391947.1 phosphonate metabolism transcriptional regulator PhnF [Methylococcaceae bacterium]MDP3018813.1 phosphonate metabolism transcriptional regulator PhnF [Methylococcaceae bacterium]MDP3391375.1 phosphonate metabolism transcriptional regulator PhnF [Methylococcaceae bacterium]